MDYSNKTQFGIQNPAERYCLMLYLLTIMLSSLLGSSLILLGSLRYHAFTLHKFVVVTIEHMAVCDLLLVLVGVFPTVVSLAADGWVAGDTLCFVQAHLKKWFVIVSVLLVTTMATSKALIVKNPLGVWNLTRDMSKRLCLFVWVLAAVPSLVIIAMGLGGSVSMDYRSYRCEHEMNEKWKIIMPGIPIVFMFIPNVLVFLSSIILIKKTVQISRMPDYRTTIMREGLVSVTLTVLVHCVSFTPLLVYFLLSRFVQPGTWFTSWFRVAKFLLPLNIVSNFFIYCLAIKRFRRFIKWLLYYRRSGVYIKASKSYYLTSRG